LYNLQQLQVATKQDVVYDEESFKSMQYKNEAQHRKYKRLKLGGGQAYDRSSV
jgi:hypothetical protein